MRRYAYSEKGRAAERKRQGTPTRLNSRHRHDAMNGYITRRVRQLDRQREQAVARLATLKEAS